MPRPATSAFCALLALAGTTVSEVSAQTNCQAVLANETLTPVVPGVVRTIVSFDDGSGAGPVFFAGGAMASVGNVARLTPGGWERAGSGLGGAVNALEVIQNGPTPTLFAGGDAGLARWTGSDWELITPSPGTSVTAIVVFDDSSGTGPALHVLAGSSLRKQTGAGWTTVANIQTSSFDRAIERVHVLDNLDPASGRPSIVFAASVFNASIPGQSLIQPASQIVRYDGASVAGLPPAPYGSWIKAAVVFDDTVHGKSLYVTGHGNTAAVSTSIARFDSTTQAWATVGPSIPFTGGAAYGMAVFADGIGTSPHLYAIGSETPIGISPQATIGAWNGSAWKVVSRLGLTNPGGVGYHLGSRAGVLGAARIPALLCVSSPATGGTAVFAVVGCPRCPADINLDGQVSMTDLFLYLEAWFAQRPSADIGSQGLTTQDIFDFIGAWFTPCP